MERKTKLLVGGALGNQCGEVVDNEIVVKASRPEEAVGKFLEAHGVYEYRVLGKENEGDLLVFRVAAPEEPPYWWGEVYVKVK